MSLAVKTATGREFIRKQRIIAARFLIYVSAREKTDRIETKPDAELNTLFTRDNDHGPMTVACAHIRVREESRQSMLGYGSLFITARTLDAGVVEAVRNKGPFIVIAGLIGENGDLPEEAWEILFWKICERDGVHLFPMKREMKEMADNCNERGVGGKKKIELCALLPLGAARTLPDGDWFKPPVLPTSVPPPSAGARKTVKRERKFNNAADKAASIQDSADEPVHKPSSYLTYHMEMDDGKHFDIPALNAGRACYMALRRHSGHRVIRCWRGDGFSGQLNFDIPAHEPLTKSAKPKPPEQFQLFAEEKESPDHVP